MGLKVILIIQESGSYMGKKNGSYMSQKVVLLWARKWYLYGPEGGTYIRL